MYVAGALSCAGSVFAASIGLDSDMNLSINLEGDIVAGDAERLVKTFLDVKPVAGTYFIYPNALVLSSRGGDVIESIRLASVVRALGLSSAVAAEGKGSCASSCFLVFLAGTPRSATGIDTLRRQGVKGNLGPLGVHRPYLSHVQHGSAGAKRQAAVMSQMAEYLRKESVPQALIDKMMTHPSNDMYWLSEADLSALGTYTPGVEEQLIANCAYDRRAEGRMSAAEWIRDSQSGAGACVSKYLFKHYSASNATIEKLRRGWRPWH